MEFKTLRMQIEDFQSSSTITIRDLGNETRIRILKKILKLFGDVPDCRVQGRITYRLNEIILMLFLATLAGSESCLGAQDFWGANDRLYRRLFGKETIPSHDTFRRILGLIKSDELNSLLVNILLNSDSAIRKALKLPAPQKKIVSVDGKQLRGTGRKADTVEEVKDLQILNVYEQDSQTCLFSEAIESKTNEIPHAQQILSRMNLKDTVVTFDAMHMQTRTIGIIAEAGGDYVGGLKGNQGKASEFARALFIQENLEKLKGIDGCYHMTSEISHNQLEQRSFYLYPLTASEKKGLFSDWRKVHALLCMAKTMRHNITGKETDEVRYYLTSLKDIGDAAHCIRAHWNIENGLHWNLDTVFREDYLALSDRTAALNQSILNKACLSLYKKMSDLIGGTQKISKKRLRKIFGWNFNDAMSQALTLMDPPTFAKSVEIIPRKAR
ncbi:MAG: ISAs1 family transposase [Sphaerochaeta sp.]|jgi:predicted transposase YbfD/YdcC|uniref:ISAs1 family transposase n=1 Tax=Sphaerochaeta sp. TaxID=1972642 RepID=UPI00258BC7B0|nr:ISAs1 family transposase [Sphaerochaeta sp.]MDD2395807.1 ISAs1 family transposase [Sphaerochaeta sp.]MDD4038204.1 ISAs1 family transposase [Sphaerochaeta sp.]MDX9985268.1 ISAs1 family transposase [Sphaerochaeta sp.]